MIESIVIIEEYQIGSLIPFAFALEKVLSLFGAVDAEDLLELDAFITGLLKLPMQVIKVSVEFLKDGFDVWVVVAWFY